MDPCAGLEPTTPRPRPGLRSSVRLSHPGTHPPFSKLERHPALWALSAVRLLAEASLKFLLQREGSNLAGGLSGEGQGRGTWSLRSASAGEE